MKRKLIIFRFGSALPTQKEFAIIDQITEGTQSATGCSTPFGVISIVKTSMTPAEIVQLFDQVAKEYGDSLPTIVFEEGDSASSNFDPTFFKEFAECNREFERHVNVGQLQCTMSLDELLDLVKEKGLSNFTEAELTRLKELSK